MLNKLHKIANEILPIQYGILDSNVVENLDNLKYFDTMIVILDVAVDFVDRANEKCGMLMWFEKLPRRQLVNICLR